MKKRKMRRLYPYAPSISSMQGCSVILQRLPASERSLPLDLLKIAQILTTSFEGSPLIYSRPEKSVRQIELNEVAIAELLVEVKQSCQNEEFKSLSLSLMDKPKNSGLIFYYREESYRSGFTKVEEVEFPRPKKTTLDMLLTAAQETCLQFNAFYGYTDNLVLGQLFGRAIRAYEKAVAAIPPGETRFYFFRAPNGIWWVNYWSLAQVEAVGRDRILSADWFQTIELANGGMILVATEEQTDVTNTEHMETLKRITEAIDLRGVQERYRVGS
jgi:hypothetical protein